MVSIGNIKDRRNAIQSGRVDFLISDTWELAGIYFRDLSRSEMYVVLGIDIADG